MSLPRNMLEVPMGGKARVYPPQPDARRATSLHTQHADIRPPVGHRRAISAGQGEKTRWPPPPTVEEEAHSLAREKSPPRAQHPGDDVHTRGIVDQVPIMEDTGLRSHSVDENLLRPHGASTFDVDSSKSRHPDESAERRFVLLSDLKSTESTKNSQRAHEGAMSANGKLRAERSRSGLRIDPGAAGGGRPTGERFAHRSALAAGHDSHGGAYVVSPGPMPPSWRAASLGKPDQGRMNGGQYTPDRLHSEPNHFDESWRSASMPRQAGPSTAPLPYASQPYFDPRRWPNAPGVPASDASSVSDARGRNRKPRSRANSYSSSGSESPGSPLATTTRKRSSQYSYTATSLPKEKKPTAPYPTTRASGASTGSINMPNPSQYMPHHHPSSSNPHSIHEAVQANTSTQNRVPSGDQHKTTYRSPQPSPRASPVHSPFTTPPPSPGHDWTGGLTAEQPKGHSRQGSRPVTPSLLSPPTVPGANLQPHTHTHPVGHGQRPSSRPGSTQGTAAPAQPQMVEVNRGSFGASTAQARQTSPLPSAVQRPTEAASLKASSVPTPQLPPRPNEKHVAPEPIANGGSVHPKSEKPPPLPHRPAPSHLEPKSPMNQTRHSRSFEFPPRSPVHADPTQAMIRSRSAVPYQKLHLPACPRPTFERGHTDWSTLPGHPDFDICPTCRRGLEEAGIEARFIPADQTSQTQAIRCDMSIPWVRMAWLLLLQRRPTHPTVIHQVTSIISHEKACPGRQLTERKWYRLYDAENGKFVSNFDMCLACVRLVAALFPNLQGVFYELPSSSKQVRNCDLRMDSRRFVGYVDMLDNISQQAFEYRREANMLRFVSLARKMAAIPVCREDDQLLEQPWHFIPHLPDFTVCEECYKDAVYPQIKSGSELAAKFNRSLKFPPHTRLPLSCQLYSERMRDIWFRASDEEDFELLRSSVMQRVAKERELQARHAMIIHLSEGERLREGANLVAEWKRWA